MVLAARVQGLGFKGLFLTSRNLRPLQALFPWQAIFRSMFAHDRTTSVRRTRDLSYLRAEGTDLGRRLKEGGLGFDDCLAVVAVALGFEEEDLPILPSDPARLNQTIGRKQPPAVVGDAAQLDGSQPDPRGNESPAGIGSPGGMEFPGGIDSPPLTFAAFRQTSLEAAVGLQRSEISEIHAKQPAEHLHHIGKSTRPPLLALAEQQPGPQPDSTNHSHGSSGQSALAKMAGEAASVEEGAPGAADSGSEEALNATRGGAASFSGRINSHENRWSHHSLLLLGETQMLHIHLL